MFAPLAFVLFCGAEREKKYSKELCSCCAQNKNENNQRDHRCFFTFNSSTIVIAGRRGAGALRVRIRRHAFFLMWPPPTIVNDGILLSDGGNK